jgi:DNA mismatch endonuclease (patch repair protein)
MKRVKLKGGPLERVVQREFERIELPFEKNCKELPGSPDIVLREDKVAVFVDGDFWHGWRLPAWEHKLTEFWRSKLHANRKRDRRNFRRLRAAGWTVIRIWEHELKSDIKRAMARVEETVAAGRTDNAPKTYP